MTTLYLLADGTETTKEEIQEEFAQGRAVLRHGHRDGGTVGWMFSVGK